MKNNKRSKRIILVVTIISIVVCFIVYSQIWAKIVFDKYDKFTKGAVQWNQLTGSNLLHGRGYSYNENGFDYNIKYPDFLSYTGNLGITNPDGTLSLIIWPKFGKETRYGIMINSEKETHCIMVDKKMAPIDKSYKKIVEENKVSIKELFDKANKQWDF